MQYQSLVGQEVELTPQERSHYGRHLLLPDIGMKGQKKLKAAKVLMIGAGGLGSPLGLYLAAAGVGTMGIVEFDHVEISNLHRQVLFSVEQVGKAKLTCAKERLLGINPHINIVGHEMRLCADNALEIFKDYDLIVDGTDNFQTRYLINDACVLLGKPNVYAAIFGFEGQLSVNWPGKGPCYRCLYPEPPPPGMMPSCSEAGVLGVLPGIMGTLQANETIKVLLGIGEPLVGRLLKFDALKMKFQEFEIRRQDDCPICSELPTQTALIDYENFCGLSDVHQPEYNNVIQISVDTVDQWLQSSKDFTLLDVREEAEWRSYKIDGALHFPLSALESIPNEVDVTKVVVCYCQAGVRSERAAKILLENGVKQVYSMSGGIAAWGGKVSYSS